MKNKTFKQLYEDAKALPRPHTPAQQFVKDVAALTQRGELAVYNWLAGRQRPDPLVIRIIGEHFGVDPEGLFPERKQ